MDGNVWRKAHLTHEQREVCRLTAATVVRQGRLSEAEVVWRSAGVRVSVSRWANPLPCRPGRALPAPAETV